MVGGRTTEFHFFSLEKKEFRGDVIPTAMIESHFAEAHTTQLHSSPAGPWLLLGRLVQRTQVSFLSSLCSAGMLLR